MPRCPQPIDILGEFYLQSHLVSAAMVSATLVCVICHQVKHGWIHWRSFSSQQKKSNSELRHRKQRLALSARPLMARGRPSWKGRIQRLKEISCTGGSQNRSCTLREWGIICWIDWNGRGLRYLGKPSRKHRGKWTPAQLSVQHCLPHWLATHACSYMYLTEEPLSGWTI